MSRIKTIDSGWLFYCMACKSMHKLDARFIFNYDMDKPTFKPKIQLTVGPFAKGHPLEGQTVKCESTITKGVIKYLETSTHSMKGQTMGLVDFAELAALQRAQEEARRSTAMKVD